MSKDRTCHLPPIERTIDVSWDPSTAFERFTVRFAEWWPVHTHSIGKIRVARVVFETRLDGLICEEHRDGRRFQWGKVTLWEPPRRVGFLWHPSRDPSTAQDVEIGFSPLANGTRVTLRSWGWERWGKGAKSARSGYRMGWGYVLKLWAEQRTVGMAMLDLLIPIFRMKRWLSGGLDAAINRAGGEIAPVHRPT